MRGRARFSTFHHHYYHRIVVTISVLIFFSFFFGGDPEVKGYFSIRQVVECQRSCENKNKNLNPAGGIFFPQTLLDSVMEAETDNHVAINS